MKINCKRVNDLVIVVIDGKIYNRTGVTDSVWLKILETKEELLQEDCLSISNIVVGTNDTYEKFMDLVEPSRVVKKEKEKKVRLDAIEEAQLEIDFDKRIKKAKRIADISGLFEYDEEGITYLKGFKHPMPKLLVEALLDAYYNPKSEYTVDSLVNFWKYLLLNPDKHVRKGLFQWLKTGKFAITEDGNIIAYRNVNIKKESSSKKLQDFISENYSKVKRWKKSPKNYWIYTSNDGDYYLTTSSKPDNVKLVNGNLAELYADLDTDEDTNIYKPQHSGPYGQEIVLGKEVTMPREECDNDPDESCSRGLHSKSASYGMGFGDITIVTLVNPYKVVAIPTHDTSKFRSCGYLPVSLAEIKDGQLVEFNPGTYDIPYNGLEGLADILKTTSLEELQEKGEISKDISTEDFKYVMNKAKEVISKRTIKIENND